MIRFVKTKRVSWAGQKGFSLLEAMIAMAVFSVGILAVAAMGPVAMDTNTAANDSSIVTNSSIGAVERVFAMNWDADSFQTQPCTDPGPYDNGDLDISWCITENTSHDEDDTAMGLTDERGRPAVRLITVTMTDSDRRGGNRDLTLKLLRPKI